MNNTPISFNTERECQTWIQAERLCALPHLACGGPNNGRWIAIAFEPVGVFALVNSEKMILLPGW